jgi:hypothetical protein
MGLGLIDNPVTYINPTTIRAPSEFGAHQWFECRTPPDLITGYWVAIEALVAQTIRRT